MTKQKSLLRRTNAAAGRKAAATAASAVHNIGGGSAPTTTVIKAVEMPVEFLRWFLSQTSEDYHVPSAADYSPEAAAGEERETAVRRVNADVQATKDDFAAFQAWVRGVVENNNGRVVLGRSANPKELQEIIDGEWALARRELAGDDYDDVTDTEEGGEGAAMAASSSSSKKVKVLRGPHLQTLSIYLSLIYQHMR